MVERKNLKSNTMPADYNTDTHVIKVSNIRKTVEIDPVFKKEYNVYIFDETQYTALEWYMKENKELREIIKILENKTRRLIDEVTELKYKGAV